MAAEVNEIFSIRIDIARTKITFLFKKFFVFDRFSYSFFWVISYWQGDETIVSELAAGASKSEEDFAKVGAALFKRKLERRPVIAHLQDDGSFFKGHETINANLHPHQVTPKEVSGDVVTGTQLAEKMSHGTVGNLSAKPMAAPQGTTRALNRVIWFFFTNYGNRINAFWKPKWSINNLSTDSWRFSYMTMATNQINNNSLSKYRLPRITGIAEKYTQ